MICSSSLVHLLVVLLVLAGGDAVHPLLVVEVPAHGLLDALLELEARLPAELALQLAAVDGVAHVVPLAVGHVGDQVHVLALGASEQAVHRPDQHPHDVDVLPLVEAPDVVGLGDSALVEYQVDRPRVVLHVEPVAHVLALPVDRKRLAVAYVVDEQRYQLLRELVGAVVVGAVGHYRGHAVGVVVGAHEVVGARLARAVGAVRAVLRLLGEELLPEGQVLPARRGRRAERGLHALGARHLQGPVDLVGGDVVEALPLVASGLPLPAPPRGLKQAQGAQHVGAREGERVADAAVHVALRREVDHPVHAVALHKGAHLLEVADVRALEHVVRARLHVLQVLQIPRVGQLVHIDYAVFGVLLHEQPHYV